MPNRLEQLLEFARVIALDCAAGGLSGLRRRRAGGSGAEPCIFGGWQGTFTLRGWGGFRTSTEADRHRRRGDATSTRWHGVAFELAPTQPVLRCRAAACAREAAERGRPPPSRVDAGGDVLGFAPLESRGRACRSSTSSRVATAARMRRGAGRFLVAPPLDRLGPTSRRRASSGFTTRTATCRRSNGPLSTEKRRSSSPCPERNLVAHRSATTWPNSGNPCSYPGAARFGQCGSAL
jgi:hypothetical protein